MQNITDNIYILLLLAMLGTFLLVGSFILINIRSQNKILKQRQQLQRKEIDHQKDLLQTIIESQETERKRIGQDLHDDVGTALSSLRLTIEMFKPDKSDKYALLSKEIIDKVIKDVRNISHNLSPPALTYYGLAAAIEEKCAIINQSGSLNINLVNNAETLLENITMPAAMALYRVLEELVNNTIKHAGATRSLITFTNNGDRVLSINYSDNGKGMNPSTIKKGMGLQNIESRLTVINATYAIDPTTAKGFSIEIKYTLP